MSKKKQTNIRQSLQSNNVTISSCVWWCLFDDKGMRDIFFNIITANNKEYLFHYTDHNIIAKHNESKELRVLLLFIEQKATIHLGVKHRHFYWLDFFWFFTFFVEHDEDYFLSSFTKAYRLSIHLLDSSFAC